MHPHDRENQPNEELIEEFERLELQMFLAFREQQHLPILLNDNLRIEIATNLTMLAHNTGTR